MKSIIAIMSVLILATSCEVEELTVNDVEDDTILEDTVEIVVDPASIIVPCTLVPNNFYLNYVNSNVSSVVINSPDLSLPSFHAGYGLYVNLTGSSEVEVYFKTAPTSGYYTGNGSAFVVDTSIVMRKILGGSYYYVAEESTVYVQDYTDSTVISWCDVAFEGTDLTLYGGKGKFTVLK